MLQPRTRARRRIALIESKMDAIMAAISLQICFRVVILVVSCAAAGSIAIAAGVRSFPIFFSFFKFFAFCRFF